MPDEELYRPWGTVTPAFWGTGAPEAAAFAEQPPVPAAIRDRMAAVAAASTAGHPAEAAALAHRLDTEITAQYGEAHLHTVHIREVRAHLAYLANDHVAAVGWYLHTARLRAAVQGQDHPDTAQATRRVYSLWRTLPAPDAGRLGAQLLAAVIDIHGPDAPLVTRIRRRLASLTTAARA
ncbi:hypothetical protein OG729_10105 [Streptomyces sp. NBC_00210]|uniref:hypothetical protein n=1 Tax=Streptomyces sp. NBC_00210 TaxID=2903636 RepID=UPI00325398E0